MSNVAVIPQNRREAIQVFDPIPILDTGRFEHMQRIAAVMAECSLIPESLYMEGKGEDRQQLPAKTILSNCFLVVNQAVRWNMDPFAVAQCVSIVHGKLCYEGKLIHAVIEERTGIRLKYEWNDKPGDALGIVVSGKYQDEDEIRTISGTVGEWKTTGSGSPWPKQPRKQLAYRGAREWARLHAPAVMLGVYTPDDFDDLANTARSVSARDITPPIPPIPPVPQIETKDAEPPAPAVKEPPMPPVPATATVTVDVVDLYRTAADTAQDGDELDAAWREHVEPHLDGMKRETYEALMAIDDQARGRLEA